MKKTSLIAALLLATTFAAAPAMAKTSLSKGKKLCEAAAKAEQPAPKTVYVDKNETTISDASLTFKLRVKKSDDSSVRHACAVDRETDAATLAPEQ